MARALLLLTAAIMLVTGLVAGLVRTGWSLPFGAGHAMAHGPLMIAAFLATLIALERAVALGGLWLLSPAVNAVGGLLLVFGAPAPLPAAFCLAGSAGLVAMYVSLLARRVELSQIVMALAAVALAVGDLLWVQQQPVSTCTWWWLVFLVWTIAGERLELSRLLRLTVWRIAAFCLPLVVGVLALLVSFGLPLLAPRGLGLSLLLLAIWLLWYDLARRNLKLPGLPGYIARCLVGGHAWLAVGGALLLWRFPAPAGPHYDAALHAVFLGFVFAMIFGHAPVILPAVLKFQPPDRIRLAPLYAALLLLHLSLLLRLVGDLADLPVYRQWGGLGNAVSILIFGLGWGGQCLCPHRRVAAGQ